MKPGDRVVVRDGGPFDGREGRVQRVDGDRVAVLLDVAGGEVAFPTAQVRRLIVSSATLGEWTADWKRQLGELEGPLQELRAAVDLAIVAGAVSGKLPAEAAIPPELRAAVERAAQLVPVIRTRAPSTVLAMIEPLLELVTLLARLL